MRSARSLRLLPVLLLTALLLAAAVSCSPAPTNEQILEAVEASNEAEAEPLDLVYEEMEVPHRYSGKAHAIFWVPDKSVQRNFTIVYDRKAGVFYVESYITLLLGEDGVYRIPRGGVPSPPVT